MTVDVDAGKKTEGGTGPNTWHSLKPLKCDSRVYLVRVSVRRARLREAAIADYLDFRRSSPGFGIDVGAQSVAHLPFVHPDTARKKKIGRAVCAGQGGKGSFRFGTLKEATAGFSLAPNHSGERWNHRSRVGVIWILKELAMRAQETGRCVKRNEVHVQHLTG